MTYFRKFCYPNSSCLRKGVTLTFMSFSKVLILILIYFEWRDTETQQYLVKSTMGAFDCEIWTGLIQILKPGFRVLPDNQTQNPKTYFNAEKSAPKPK